MDIFTETEKMIAALRNFRLDIEKALEYSGGSHSFEHVAAMCITGQADLYVLPNSVIIMELHTYPNHKVYHAFIAAGDLDEIVEAQSTTLIREAQLRGAKYLTLAGRTGWTKTLKTEGWTHTLCLMQKEVPYEQVERVKTDAGNQSRGREELASQHGLGEAHCLIGV